VNLEFKGLTKDAILLYQKNLKIIVTVNAEFIVYANEDPRFKKIISENYSTLDGQLPYLLAKWLHPRVQIEKISGSDFIYEACDFAKKNGLKIFLLGGNAESNRISVERLKKQYEIEIDGFSPEYKPYPFDPDHNQEILGRIEKFKPDFLFVGFGPKKQEFWIEENKTALQGYGVKWAVGSGGTFEMVSGQISRAPKFIQSLGLERFYRIFKEPTGSRMKRLLISFKFFKYIFWH
jgi:N-acetylglucosaminyldiphosphoundecaprenol N-acetyl-beta-D-mannosaminyltransferase